MHVSVIIPVYNAEHFLPQAVQSACAQRETGEVILVEDGSSDGSLHVCRQLEERFSHVTVLRHKEDRHQGISASRNLGLRAARCPHIAFLDADDYYLPERFRAARAVLDCDPDIDGVYDAVGIRYENDDARTWYCGQGRPEMTTITEAVDPVNLFEAILSGDKGFFHTNGIVVRKELFDRTGLFDPSLPMCEDTAMWIKMAAVGKLVAGCISNPVSIRRVHGENTTQRDEARNKMYQLQMAESLMHWGQQTSLSAKRMRLLQDLLLRFRLNMIDRNAPYLRRKMREMGCLARFAATHPAALRSRYYREVVGYTVGWRRCKRSMVRLFGGRGERKRETAYSTLRNRQPALTERDAAHF